MDRSKKVGGPPQVFQQQFENELLTGRAFVELRANSSVICRAVLNRMIEDCWVRGIAGQRKVVDVALKRSAIEQIACDVVQPNALSQVVKKLCRFHCSLNRLQL